MHRGWQNIIYTCIVVTVGAAYTEYKLFFLLHLCSPTETIIHYNCANIIAT